MGTAASKSTFRGVVVSFDALGTLYRFREPITAQYITIARQCGLQAHIDESKLQKAFKSSFKALNSQFPNYGKGNLDSPEIWWTKLVKEAFKDLVNPEPLPENLGLSLYEHFSSAKAYELYPDVTSFLTSIKTLRSKYQGLNDPTIIVGVITNSDPRVRQVLQSLGLKVGISGLMPSSVAEIREQAEREVEESRNSGESPSRTQMHLVWDERNDFDFLATSYEADSEKPNPEIFRYARQLAGWNSISRSVKAATDGLVGARWMIDTLFVSWKHRMDIHEMAWIHVGDEYVKDYQGARNAGLEALHLARPNEVEAKPNSETVSSLDEVSAVVHLMIAQNSANN